MITLAIDTAGPAASVALWRGTADRGEALAMASEPMLRGHAEAVMPMVRSLVAETLGPGPKGFAAIGLVVALNGPGSFTGIRIGVAAARGLALAIGCPVVAVTAFEVAAALFIESGGCGKPFCVAFDARRGQVYLQEFDAAGIAPNLPEAVDLEAVADAIAADSAVVLGSGAGLIAENLSQRGRNLCLHDGPTSDAMVTARLGTGKPVGDPPLPLYLRRPDAKPQKPPLARVAVPRGADL